LNLGEKQQQCRESGSMIFYINTAGQYPSVTVIHSWGKCGVNAA